MVFGHFEIGIWHPIKPRTLKDYLEFSYIKCHCGCTILTISIFYFTWLRNDCYTKRNEI